MTQLAVLWERLGVCVDDAMSLARRMQSSDSLRRDYDLKWALVKHVENAQETVKALDVESDKQLFKALSEIPEEPSGNALTWRGLIAMRQVLAHKFWDIDHDIVWDAVTNDFQSLQQVITTTSFLTTTTDITNGRSFGAWVGAKDLRRLNAGVPGEPWYPGDAIVCVFQDATHGLGAVYFGRNDKNQLLWGVGPDWMGGRRLNLRVHYRPPAN